MAKGARLKKGAGHAAGELPAGLKLRHTLRGHKDAVFGIAWSPDGKRLASGSRDNTIRLWDANTGQSLHVLEGYKKFVRSVAWSPDARWLASSGDEEIHLWDTATWTLADTLKGHAGLVCRIAWSPHDAILASGSEDNSVRLWSVGTPRLISMKHDNPVMDVIWSPDGTTIASASYDGTILLWDASNGALISTLRGHSSGAFSLAWSPDAQTIASGAALDDPTVKIWAHAAKKEVTALEGHTTGYVKSLSYSFDGRLLASKSGDGTVRIWRCDTWSTVAILSEPSTDYWPPSLAFHPRLPVLATLGEKDTVIRIWDLDVDALLGAAQEAPAVHYTTAKIVLVGDSGVGKTGLGWRLAHGAFREHPSTHGQQFWLLDALRTRRADGTDCEAVLWDLAGQPDYRLIHALFLDDAELALILFNPADLQEPLRGVEFWLKALSHRKEGACRTILVGARTDRGEPALTPEDLEAFCRERGIQGGYLGTSALHGQGLDTLVERMKALIPWDGMTATVTTATFKRIKEHVLALKEKPERRGVLVTPDALRRELTALDPDWAFSDAEMMTAVGHLDKHGYVRVLRTAAGEQRILLVPELLNNLAASFVLEARRNPKGLGALEEERLLRREYRFPELDGLDEPEQAILLDAAARLFVEHHVCFRESLGVQTLLIFPELINLRRPRMTGETPVVDDVSYTVSGAVENVYAALVVLLGYTNTFTRTAQWQGQAEYEVDGKEICGFREIAEREGEIDLVLYRGETTRDPTRLLFQHLFEKFLTAREVSLVRYPPIKCAKCGYRQARDEVVRRIREQRTFMFCGECGKKTPLPKAAESVVPEAYGRDVAEQQATAAARTAFEAALVQVKGFIRDRGARTRAPRCFVSYAWGEPAHQRWVEKRLAADLRNAGVEVVIDRDNQSIGANISRFVSLIAGCDAVVVVGTPAYRLKYENGVSARGSVVAAEFDLIAQRLLGTEEEKATVLPLLLQGTDRASLPPLLLGRVFADFRREADYFAQMFDLILTLHRIDPGSAAFAETRAQLSPRDPGR